MNLGDLITGRIAPPPLEPDRIQIWRISTGIPPDVLAALEPILSADERARAARFYFERDRRSFVACRSCLRLLAGGHSKLPPDQIRFRYGPQGKPALLLPAQQIENAVSKNPNAGVQFNVSHSGEMGLLAFSAGFGIGIDVEWMRPNVDFLGLARASFSAVEYEAIAKLPPEGRAALFYEYWSCKEACIKADGRGVSAGLDQFSVVSSKAPDWRAVSAPAIGGISEQMRIRILDVGKGYAAAVASPASGWDVVLLTLAVDCI